MDELGSLELEVETIDHTGNVDPAWLALIDCAVAATMQLEHSSGRWDISIALVSDPQLAELHEDFLDDPTITDVMSFPLEFNDPIATAEIKGGEIVIAIERASEQAKMQGWSSETELAFLAIHGTLHLLGWTDSTPGDRAAMLSRQREILRRIEIDHEFSGVASRK